MLTQAQSEQLRRLPAVEKLLEQPQIWDKCRDIGRDRVVGALRQALDETRARILRGELSAVPTDADLLALAEQYLPLDPGTLLPVINATGVIVHTNLGRSVLCPRAARELAAIAEEYSSLEMELESGKRGSRQAHVRELLCELTGAGAAVVFNNNACGVMLALTALAGGREVIVSRGQLVEIGGSFRMPDVMAQSGCKMVEVGCTNRTHLRDYADAITESTGAILRVHPSNYRIVGFTTEPSIAELAELAHDRGLMLVDDIGSGALLDLSRFGINGEPLVEDSVKAGADAVCFSGDKLLGGPQAGIIVGSPAAVARIAGHPLARALRVDKLTVAALLGTLQTWRNPEVALAEIPTLRMLVQPVWVLQARAERTLAGIRDALAEGWAAEVVVDDSARMGGGALPEVPIPTAAVRIAPPSDGFVAQLAHKLRTGERPVVSRAHEHAVVLDMRTVFDGQVEELIGAVTASLREMAG